VSDVRVVQEGLLSVLAEQRGIDVVSTSDTQRARDESARLHPDVVLFDAMRQDGLGFVRELVAAAPGSKVVAFGVRETEEQILALAAAGTAGYIRDSAGSSDVVRVLERVMCGELLCSPSAAALLYRRVGTLTPLARGPGGRDGDNNLTPLSRRELEIASLLDNGLTNKEIARKLGIEAATVKNHVHNICDKLKVHRRGEAVARVRAMLSPHPPLPPAAAVSAAPHVQAPLSK
jgi:DNA-binding NarL/FixJ family response regulator